MPICFIFAIIFNLLSSVTALPLQHDSTENISAPGNFNGQAEQKQGWTPSPDGRGTVNILWTSIFTWVLCGWTTLSLNVPAPNHTAWSLFRQKASVFMLVTVGPEILAVTVLGQYMSARRSVHDFAAAGISDWTFQRASFADMGGFVLQTRDWVPFPINAKQLLWLIQHKFISVPPMSPNSIKDKNKLDGITRLIMAFQLLWFCANFFARISKGYAITCIELNIMALIYFTLPMMFFWRHKPVDVETAEVLNTEASMAEILLAGGDAAQEPYSQTPLDFVSHKEWVWLLYWSHFKHALQRFHILRREHNRPVNRLSNVSTPEFPIWMIRIGFVVTLGYFAIFMMKWNSSFPTDTERLLWRSSCVICIVTIFAGEIFTDWLFYCWPYIQKKWGSKKDNKTAENSTSLSAFQTNHDSSLTSGAGHHRAVETGRRPPRNILEWARNPTASQDPRYALPLKVVLFGILITVLHWLARFYILVEDFLELRWLPLSAYKTMDWEQALPHFG